MSSFLATPLPERLVRTPNEDRQVFDTLMSWTVLKQITTRAMLLQKINNNTALPKDCVFQNGNIVHLPTKRIVITADQFIDVKHLAQPRQSRL
jgi:hypothetical protein